MWSEMAESELQRTIIGQRAIGMKGEHRDNYAIARDVLHGELGFNGKPVEDEYNLDQSKLDTLVAHGRQDAAHALCNTKSLLDLNGRISQQLKFANILLSISVCFLAAIVNKLYPQFFGGVH
jgi:hypothetical protein